MSGRSTPRGSFAKAGPAIVRELTALLIPVFRAESLEAVETCGVVEECRTPRSVRFRA